MLKSPKQESNRSLQNNFILSTPIGFFWGTIENGYLSTFTWSNQKPFSIPTHPSELVEYIKNSLDQYFHKKVTTWDFTFQLPGTAEEQKVYIALMKVPYGTTITYSELAAKINKPKAVRWVAHVCAKNPLPLVIPCHRVVRKDQIGQYSAGGIIAKKWLIDHERSMASAEYKQPSLSATLCKKEAV